MKTCLVIEDNEDNMELISFILEKHGYQVLKAQDGQRGIDTALTRHPDFILLDIQLPDMDGLDVLKRLRGSGINGNLPIIAVTSYAMAGDRERMLAAGCNGYIEKPIDPERVMAQIERVIGA